MKAICLISTFAMTLGFAAAAEAQYPVAGQAYTVTQQPLYTTPVRGSYYQQASYQPALYGQPVTQAVRYGQPVQPVSHTVRYGSQPVATQQVSYVQPATTFAGGAVGYQPASACNACGSPCGTTVAYQGVVAEPVVDSKYYVGRNLLGKPKLYGHGQPIRNFLRWLGP